MCGCDVKKKDTSKLANITYDDYCNKLGFCKESCFEKLDEDDRYDIEFNHMFNNLVKNSKNKIFSNSING